MYCWYKPPEIASTADLQQVQPGKCGFIGEFLGFFWKGALLKNIFGYSQTRGMGCLGKIDPEVASSLFDFSNYFPESSIPASVCCTCRIPFRSVSAESEKLEAGQSESSRNIDMNWGLKLCDWTSWNNGQSRIKNIVINSLYRNPMI